MTVALIDTGCANIFSVEAALNRIGADFDLVESPEDAENAERLILPGVGAAGPAMVRLTAAGWTMALRDEKRPVLGICLGMQLLFGRSAEGGVETVGVIEGEIAAMMPPRLGVLPHMGWNTLQLQAEDPLISGIADNSHVYFVHGYAAPVGTVTLATTDYGAPFSAIVRQGNFMGCQFHPERSGAVGRRILQNFVELPA
ncbi:imidazole glycerol phosphate synthase subunit HisH [Hyphobacterium sp.]|uniref:imidazole glycerol phosphate synthase subunit HisH n=1 Tax=Hyphobacterium sp. TaxID=2004662 RepID=UPI003BA895EA